MRCTALFLAACVFTGLGNHSSADDWRQFRGNLADGISQETDVVTSLSGENIQWAAELPGRGLSGPIVVGERVYVSCSSGYREDRLHVMCFDDKTGEKLWQRQFWATGQTVCHQKMCVATPTPASDGERVFAFFSSNDLVCLDLDGNLLWFRGLTHDFPNAANSLGMSSSPIVVGDTVIVQVESDAESFATGLDVANGKPRWKIDRPRRANWTSPTILPGGTADSTLVVLQSSEGIDVIEPRTGKVVSSFSDGASTIPSSTVADGVIYIPSNGLTALRIDAGEGKTDVIWNEGRLSPSTPSPIVWKGKVYTVNRAGVLACADTESGEREWQLRLKGPYSSTPIVANDHMYFFNETGFAQIVKLGETKAEVISEMDFAETILCTPAIANGSLYVRSDKHLWKLGEN